MAATSAIFKGSYTKLLTALGLSIEAGQHIKWVDGAALYAVLVSDAGGILTLQALPAAAVPSLDASKITSGVLDIARIPAAALERLVVVADQAARYALTTSTVQLGDTVLQTDTNILYMVKDEANLGNANGYQAYVAATAADVPNSVVLAKVLTGMVLADGAPVATDTILQAFGKLSRVPLTDASNQSLSGFTATSIVGALNEEKAATVDQESTGWVSFSGSGNYYSYSSGTFTVLRAGVGRIKGQKITWAGGESVAGLSANKGYLIGFSATNTLVAIDITTLENSSKKVLMDNYLATYMNNVMLFGIWTDGANPVIVKEAHEYAYPTEISIHDHFRLGQTFSFSGAQLSVLNAAARTIQTSGEDLLDDHGLETRVPDAAGSAIDAMAIFQNAGGVAQGLNRRTFTVSGITTAPTAGATYTNNGSTFTVVYTTLTGVAPNISGTIATWTSSGNNNPLASGTLTKASGTGDATIAFSAYSVPNTISTLYAPAGVPTSLSTAGATRYGLVAVYCSKDDLQTPSTAAPTPKYFQVLSNTAYNSTANAANSIGTGTSPDLTQFILPSEMKAIELVLNGFVIVDGNGRTIPAVSTNGFVNGVKTTKAVLGASSLAGAVSATTANNVSLDTSNFNGNLSSLDINTQVEAETIDDIPMVKGRNYLNQWNTSVAPIGTVENSIAFTVGVSTRATPTAWGSTDTTKLTIAQTAVSPLDGVYSYALTHVGVGAASIQTPLFNLSLVDVGTPQVIRFDISGVTASGDYDIVLDRYNSSNVFQESIVCAGTASAGTPASALLPVGTGRFASFAITGSTATDKYALRFRRLSASDTASPKIDELYVGPNVQGQGSAIGAWRTPTTEVSLKYDATTATNITSYATKYRPVGDSIDWSTKIIFSGAANANGAFRIYLPDGLTINTTSNATSTRNILIRMYTATKVFSGIARIEASQYISILNADSAGSISQFWAGNTVAGSNVPGLAAIANNDELFVDVHGLPVNELSSNVTLANRAVESYAAEDGSTDVFGPNGALVPNAGTDTTAGQTFVYPETLQSTDKFDLEFKSPDNVDWHTAPIIDASGAKQIDSAHGENTKYYGASVRTNASANTVSVFFGNATWNSAATYGAAGAAGHSWGTYRTAGWRFRLRKVSSGASVGYPINVANIIAQSGTQLFYKEDLTTYAGNFKADNSTNVSGSVTMKVVRIGNQVTITVPSFTLTANASDSLIFSNTMPLLAAEFRPAATRRTLVEIQKAGSVSTSPGLMQVNTDGSLYFYAAPAAPFYGAGASGLFSNQSITYVL